MLSALKDRGFINYHRIVRIRRDICDHIHTGPWRRTWVLKNYDYKTDPQARMHQVVEFRGNASKQVFVR